MPKINPLILDDYSSGNLRGVSKYKMPMSGVPFSINFVYDEEIGKAKLRKGSSMVGAQIVNNAPVLGLVNFRRRSDTNHALLAVVSDGVNNDTYKATAWAKSLEDDTKDLKTRFVQFLDSVVRANGTDAPKSFNGTSWVTTGGVFDLANMPIGKYLENFKDRIHVIDDQGILNSSSVPRFYLAYDAQSANFNVGARITGGTSGATGIIFADTDGGATGTLQITGISGTFQDGETLTDDGTVPGSATSDGAEGYQISWTSGYVTTLIDPDNGEKGKCTGIKKIGGLLFIFFERATYTWNGSSTQPDPIIGIGCSSNESIAVDKVNSIMFFANENGVFVTKGGFPQKISRFVDDLFDNMSSVNYSKIASGTDGKHEYTSIGDVTIDGITISNCVIRYTIQSQEWALLSFPTQPLVFSQYIDGTTVKLVFGDDDGNVIQIDSTAEVDNYSSTTNAPINYEIQTRDIFQPVVGMNKTIKDKITVDSEESSGAKIYYRKDKNKNRQEDWIHLKEIKEDIENIKIGSIGYKVLRFKIAGRSTKGRFTLESIIATDGDNHGY